MFVFVVCELVKFGANLPSWLKAAGEDEVRQKVERTNSCLNGTRERNKRCKWMKPAAVTKVP